MYSYNELKVVHLEMTDKCNAACPQCCRNDHGGKVNPRLPLVELSLKDIQRIFPVEFLSQLESVFACGNYGDPIIAKDTLEVFRYFRSCSDRLKLSLHTNGGARTIQWWVELAGVLTTERGSVIFGIDGLEDTNHIYRRNVKWSVMMRNARAFIGAGGRAHWTFLVFRHNEHQVDAAKKMAEALGFRSFTAKKTKRFADYQNMRLLDRTPIKDVEGKVIDWLERPLTPQWRTENLGQFEWHNNTKMSTIREHFQSMKTFLDQSVIDCKASKNKEIYVTASGYVIPCCYLATHISDDSMRDEQRQILPIVEEIGGFNMINAKAFPIKEIVEGPLFQHHLPASWNAPTLESGKNHTCARICGQSCGAL